MKTALRWLMGLVLGASVGGAIGCRSSRPEADDTPATAPQPTSIAPQPTSIAPQPTMIAPQPTNIEPPTAPVSAGPSASAAGAPSATTAEPTTALDPRLLTAGITDVTRQTEVRRQVGMRTGRHEGYERVVFEFEAGVPGYHVEYIDKPVRACGSGDVVEIAGDGWLEVRLSPAAAHTDEGKATIGERQLTPKMNVILEVERTCDFEGIVTWVVGTASPNKYRVFELSDPPRLVLDIATR